MRRQQNMMDFSDSTSEGNRRAQSVPKGNQMAPLANALAFEPLGKQPNSVLVTWSQRFTYLGSLTARLGRMLSNSPAVRTACVKTDSEKEQTSGTATQQTASTDFRQALSQITFYSTARPQLQVQVNPRELCDHFSILETNQQQASTETNLSGSHQAFTSLCIWDLPN